MKVRDLIEQLSSFDGETDVVFAYNYGDYWKTVVAQSVSEALAGLVVHSPYHNVDKVVHRDTDEDPENIDGVPIGSRNVIILA